MPRGNIRAEIARRLILSAGVLVRLALFCFFLLLVSQLFVAAARAADAVSAVRVWPAQDYTRVTLESLRPIRHTLLAVKNPERLVLDLEGVEFAGLQQGIAGKVVASDPHVANLRAGRYQQGVVRLVLDLKQEVKPQIFLLKPVGEYGHRLVLDIYPAQPIDPLMALLAKPEARAQVEPAPAAEAKYDSRPAQPETSVAALQPPKPAPKEDPSKPESITRLITIALDAGHGGEDPGARGRGGSREKHVTLTIARKLKTIIDGDPNMRAVLTRDGDYYLPLSMRVEKARRVKSDLFVSIHADAFVRPNASGSSVFALSERGATSAAARWLAQRENAADLIGGVNLGVKDRYLAQTLLDLSQTATIQDSLKVARSVLSEIGDVNRLHKHKVEQAGFAVLKAPDIPSILVETAFISNPDEERRLNDDAYQDKMAQALFRGIKRYFAKNPPLSRSTVASLQ